MARKYIADCKGFTTGEFTAASDRAALDHAVEHFSHDFSRGVLEVWDVRSDNAVFVVDLMDYIKAETVKS
jgi:hypothetical protein